MSKLLEDQDDRYRLMVTISIFDKLLRQQHGLYGSKPDHERFELLKGSDAHYFDDPWEAVRRRPRHK